LNRQDPSFDPLRSLSQAASFCGFLVIAAHVLQQCLPEQQDVNNFVSSLQLTIRSHPTAVEEREAILAVAKRGSKVLAEWIKLLEAE
jgi:hypothetical protein